MDITCPGCKGVLTVGDELRGKTVQCGQCNSVVNVDSAAASVAIQSSPGPMPTTSSAAGTAAITSEPPAEPARAGRYDDEDAMSRPPSIARQGSGAGISIAVILVILAVLALPMLACVGAGAFWFLAQGAARDEAVAVKHAHAEGAIAEVAQMNAVREQAREADIVAPKLAPEDGVILFKKNKPQPKLQGVEPVIMIERAKLDEFLVKNLAGAEQDGPLAPQSPLWAKLKREVAEGLLSRSRLSAREPGMIELADFGEAAPGDAGVLTGFLVSVDKDSLVSFVQPIFQTPDGSKLGKRYGTPAQEVLYINAKKGHAVGTLLTRSAADGLFGFDVEFMLIEEDRLNLQTNYFSAHIGGKGGELTRMGGDGRLIVGIHGRTFAKGDRAGSIADLGLLALLR